MSRTHKSEPTIELVLPDELPEVTPAVARVLLDILIELTTVPVLEVPDDDR